MKDNELESLLPDIDPVPLRQAASEPQVKAAVADLRVALAELAKCDEGDRMSDHWESTKQELVDEIRRLVLKRNHTKDRARTP